MLFLSDEILFPPELARALESALSENGRTFSAKEISRLGTSLADLWPSLAKERGLNEKKHYSSSPAFARVYSSYYLPANLLKWSFVLEEIELLSGALGKDLKILDFGCGPGTVFWGAAWWCHQKNRGLSYVGADQSRHFLSEARTHARLLREELGFADRASPAWVETGLSGREILALLKKEKPNLLTFSNSLAEIAPTPEGRFETISRLLQELRERTLAEPPSNGSPRLVIMEPASLAASRELLELRKKIIGAFPDIKIELPCLDNRPCGALARDSDWCHEEIAIEFPSWLNAIGKGAGLKKEGLLFSYLVLSFRAEQPFAGCPRVVSHRFEEKGMTRCWLCTRDGKMQARLLNSRRDDRNRAFGKIRRGDVIEKMELSGKSDVLDLLLFRDFD